METTFSPKKATKYEEAFPKREIHHKSKFARYLYVIKRFLLQIWPLVKFCFVTKLPITDLDEAFDYPKLTATKTTCYRLRRKTFTLEKLRFKFDCNRDNCDVILQPVHSRVSPILLMTTSKRNFIIPSTGYNFFTRKEVIFKKVWRGHQDFLLSAVLNEMIIIPQDYKDERRQVSVTRTGTSGTTASSVSKTSLSSSALPNISSTSQQGTFGISSVSKSKQEITSQFSDRKSGGRKRITRGGSEQISGISSARRTIFTVSTPAGFVSANYQGDGQLENKMKQEEFLYLLSAARFVKYTYWDPYLLFYHDTLVKFLIIGVLFLALLLSFFVLTGSPTYYENNLDTLTYYTVTIAVILWLFCIGLLKFYHSEFNLLEFYDKKKMLQRHGHMRRMYDEKVVKSKKEAYKRSSVSKIKQNMKQFSFLKKYVNKVVFFILLLLSFISCIKRGKQVLTIFTVPTIIFLFALFSASFKFIVWKTVILNCTFQFFATCLIFNDYIWPHVNRLGRSFETFVFAASEIVMPVESTTNATKYSFLLFAFGVYVAYSGVLETLIYFDAFRFLNKIAKPLGSRMGITEIEASYLMMSMFCNYEHMIKVNSNLPTRFTKSELHFFLATGLANPSLPELCFYSLLGIPISHTFVFNILTMPGLVATTKLMYPEIQESQTIDRGLAPRKEPMTRQTRLLTDVWISSIASAYKKLFNYVFEFIMTGIILEMFKSLVFDSEAKIEKDILEVFSLLVQPLTWTFGIQTAPDRAFFVTAFMKRLFVNDIMALYALSERLHFSWTTSCMLILGGTVQKSHTFNKNLKTFLDMFMVNDVYQNDCNSRTLFMIIPLLCSSATIFRLLVATSHLASVLPKSRQEHLTSIGFRALASTVICKLILTIFAGVFYTSTYEVKCIAHWTIGSFERYFCAIFLRNVPDVSNKSVSGSFYGTFGNYEHTCFRVYYIPTLGYV